MHTACRHGVGIFYVVMESRLIIFGLQFYVVGVGHLIVTRYPRFESTAITGTVGFVASPASGAVR